MKKLSKETLQGMNKKQLYDYCRANGIKGYSNQNKAYITNLILQSYKSGKQPVKKKFKKPSKNIEDKYPRFKIWLSEHVNSDWIEVGSKYRLK